MLKKRMPTPKTGPNGRAYDLCHRAWRAGVVKRWHLMEDRTWSLDVGAGRVDQLTAEQVLDAVQRAVELAGITSIEWGTSWVGYRSVRVTVLGQVIVDAYDPLARRAELEDAVTA